MAIPGISDAVELVKTIGDLAKRGVTIDLQERIADLRDAVLNVKEEVFALRAENQDLKSKLSEQEDWKARSAGYTLIEAQGGAHVYRTAGPPEHFACPRCFEERKLHILQDQRAYVGNYKCQGCDKVYLVKPSQRTMSSAGNSPSGWTG